MSKEYFYLYILDSFYSIQCKEDIRKKGKEWENLELGGSVLSFLHYPRRESIVVAWLTLVVVEVKKMISVLEC